MSQILHCVFGIIVLRGEPASITLQRKMHLSFMDPLLTHLPLVMKDEHFPTTRKFWEEYLAQPEEQAMKWANGYSRQMAESSLEDP